MILPVGLVYWDPPAFGGGGTTQKFSCEGFDDADHDEVEDVGETGDNGGVEWVNYQDDSDDFLGDFCLGVGATANRGTEIDWTRFFWDLDTKGDLTTEVPFEPIIDNYAEDPISWNDDDGGLIANRPKRRLKDAFDNVDAGNPNDEDYTTHWDEWAQFDGVDQ